ncbi:class II aldolase/adducin family protein, partial [Paenibacillus macerans]|nr:class II aldolase/adducin family protein [Paenibacillus macerans]
MNTITEMEKSRSSRDLEIPFVREMAEITYHMWRLGWDERNGGNISYLLDEAEVLKYLGAGQGEKTRSIPLSFPVKELAGKYFIVTGSGKYFRNVISDPAANLGIVRVAADGERVDVLW